MSATGPGLPQATPAVDPAPSLVSFGEAFAFWLKLGFISFGGPAGQIAVMHTELVERRRWISERRFLHALNYCMLLPGPEAQQLATYLGWLMHRSWGGIVAGALFVLPSLLILIALSWIYMAFGNLPLVAGLFYGIKPAVTAIVVHAAHRIGARALKNGALWAIAAAAFVVIFALNLWLGSNYLFIGHKPEFPSLIDSLGPWPLYVPVIIGLALILFHLLYLPFAWSDWRRPGNRMQSPLQDSVRPPF